MNSAYGLFDACLRAFSAIFANVSRLVPYFQRYSRPAPPNICAAGGAWLKPCTLFITLASFSSGFVRSVHFAASAPFSIFSKPSDEHALGDAALDRLLREHERGRAGRAVVVHVEDRDAGEAELVDGALAARRVAVDVADVRLLRPRCSRPSRPRARPCAAFAAITLYSSLAPGFWNFVIPTPMTLTLRPMVLAPCVLVSGGSDEPLEEVRAVDATRASPSTRSLPCWKRSRSVPARGERDEVVVGERERDVGCLASPSATLGAADLRSTVQSRLVDDDELHHRADLLGERRASRRGARRAP